jgi:hypothetical protein
MVAMPKVVCFYGRDSMNAGRSIHRRLSHWCMLLSSFMLATSTPAIADKDYPTSIINDSGSPATLTKCEAWARDINKTILYSHASVPNMLSDLGISFTNNSDKTITALRLEVLPYDLTNALIGLPQHLDTDTNRSADKMAVSPGASFDLLGPRSWHPGYNIFQNSDHVSCAITAVKFADGSIWTASSTTTLQCNSSQSVIGGLTLTIDLDARTINVYSARLGRSQIFSTTAFTETEIDWQESERNGSVVYMTLNRRSGQVTISSGDRRVTIPCK